MPLADPADMSLASLVVLAVVSLLAHALLAPRTTVVVVLLLSCFLTGKSLACPLTDRTIPGGPILPPALLGLWLLPRASLLSFCMQLLSTGIHPLVSVADSAIVVVAVIGTDAIDTATVA